MAVTLNRKTQPEEIWQFSRMRYIWAKDQWPNLSGRVTTIWTLQDFGLLSSELDFKTVISVANGRQYQVVNVHMSGDAEDVTIDKEAVTDGDAPAPLEDERPSGEHADDSPRKNVAGDDLPGSQSDYESDNPV